MATDQLSPRRAPHPSGDARLVKYDQYIDSQVNATRRMVKAVDLAAALVVLAAGVLAFLLAVAVVEHWLVPGGFPIAVRTLLFVVLAGGAGYFACRRLWPLVARKVNPVYAAQAIEHSGPSLKNSLVNLLLFRQHRSDISESVYQTLEEQAAQRLVRVRVDEAVDRSLLIRVGYVLLAVVAVAALYKVLSPKDPLVAAQRVLMPWAEIVPASRVSIARVEPGSVTVSRGEFITVSAEVRGIGESDAVLLRYTTSDGQAVNKAIPLKPASDGLRFEGRLPDEREPNGQVGVARNLRYRIEAGDARSLDYAVTVVAAPSILVERVEYDYPAYTGYLNRSVDHLGDIRAIEGTRITIHARANAPIDQAHIDFDANGRRDLRMDATDAEARSSFVLALRDDRQTPQHASYVLRFTNREGGANRKPVKHSIQVEPDRAPEVAILAPEERDRDVRLDETVAIEVEARDPDFALSEVRLRGEVGGRPVVDEPLLEREHTGRFTARYQFTPSAHNLRAGAVVEYWAAANDNRAPQPNAATSERKRFRIVSPDTAQEPPPDQLAQRDPQQPQPGEQQQQDGQEAGEQQDGQPGEQQPGAPGGEGQRGDDQQPQNGQQQGEQVSRDAEPGEGDGERRGGGEGEAREQHGGEGAADRDAPAEPGEQREGAQDGRGERAADGQREQGNGQAAPAADRQPVSSDGDNDAEAFDRIRQHLQREGQLPDDEPSRDGDPAPADGDREPRRRDADQFSRDAERSAAEQPDKERGREGEGEKDTEDQDAPAHEQHSQPGERADDRGEGPGAETRGDDLEPEAGGEDAPAREGSEQSESPGGEQTGSKGPPGAGDEQDPQGAPDSQPEMKPADKRQPSPSADEQTDATEPPAGADGKRESDSHGEQGGDRAGGGDEGGGQDAPREGTGSAGQNQAADDGAGESAEPGAGADSTDAGRDATAHEPTGESSDETPGRGSKQRDGQPEGETRRGGEGEAEEDAARSTGEEDESLRNDEQPFSRDAERSADAESALRDQQNGAQEPGAPTGDGGERGADASPPPRVDGTVPDGDEANLEYARKQTDLVLEKLAEQLNRKQVDEELLDEVGWSREDLRKFVERWRARKQAAQRNDQAGEAAQRELDDALRSLGLRPGALQQGPVKEDTLRDLREGYRGPVPLEYQERLRAYNQGVSRARPDGE